MFRQDDRGNVAQFMTPNESAQLARFREDPSVAGFSVISADGAEIEAHGAFEEVSGAVFANIVDVVDKMGDELGERDTCPSLFMEGADFEVSVLAMSAAKAVVFKRRPRPEVKGLTCVS